MTNEQINKTIATYTIGYEYYDMIHCWIDYDPDKLRLYGKCKNDEYWLLVPDYCNDLNAMHEALQTLISTEQQNQYINNIAEVCWADVSRGNNQVVFNQLTSTARQQAEAFLKTIGKWKE